MSCARGTDGSLAVRYNGYRVVVVLSLVLGILTSYGAPAASAPVTTPEQHSTTQPLPEVAPTTTDEQATAICEMLQTPVAEALQVEVALTATSFRDINAGVERSGCQLTSKGTGAQFTDFTVVSNQVADVLARQGWSEAQPLADGPTGTVLGFYKDGAVAQVTVEWQPAPSASCPADQPIAACELLPEQRLYTIIVEAAAV